MGCLSQAQYIVQSFHSWITRTRKNNYYLLDVITICNPLKNIALNLSQHKPLKIQSIVNNKTNTRKIFQSASFYFLDFNIHYPRIRLMSQPLSHCIYVCSFQQQIQMPHPTAIHPASMHVSAGLPANHFLPSPALASPVGSTGGSQPPNPPLAANAPCSTLFVANLGQFVSEHELKEIFAR